MMNNRIITNASWIVICKIAQIFLNLAVSMISARYLGPSNFGLISYAASVVAFFLPVVQLGINCILVQMFIDKPDQSGMIIGTATLLTTVSALLGVVGIWVFSSIIHYNEKETVLVCVLYGMSMIFQMTEMIQYWYQAKLLSKYVSIVSLVSRVVVSIYKIFIIVKGKNIYWFAVVNSFDFMIISVGLYVLYAKIDGQKLNFSYALAKEMLSRSKHFIISGVMVSIFTQTDKVMLKLIIGDEASGFYAAAATCSGIMVFLSTAIIDSMRPVLFDNKKNDEHLYHKNTVVLYSILIYLAVLQSMVLTLFSNPLILLFYGEEYMPSAAVLRIISWCLPFSYLGGARSIWFLSEGKEKYLWITNCCGALMNVVLNMLLIPLWGARGAALASLSTQLLTNFVISFAIEPLRQNAKWMLEALDLRVLWKIIKG